jgi:hypothetical protein
MRGLIAEQGPVKLRSAAFAEQSARLAGVITTLRQLTVAALVARAAKDRRASVVLPQVDGATGDVRRATCARMTCGGQRARGAGVDHGRGAQAPRPPSAPVGRCGGERHVPA